MTWVVYNQVAALYWAGEWRHDSGVCSIGVGKVGFSRVAANVFVFILTAGNHSVTMVEKSKV